MTTSPSAAELVHLVTAIPGVRGIEPGLASTLKVIGKRMQQQESQQEWQRQESQWQRLAENRCCFAHFHFLRYSWQVP